jgi:hypothetical protein
MRSGSRTETVDVEDPEHPATTAAAVASPAPPRTRNLRLSRGIPESSVEFVTGEIYPGEDL